MSSSKTSLTPWVQTEILTKALQDIAQHRVSRCALFARKALISAGVKTKTETNVSRK